MLELELLQHRGACPPARCTQGLPWGVIPILFPCELSLLWAPCPPAVLFLSLIPVEEAGAAASLCDPQENRPCGAEGQRRWLRGVGQSSDSGAWGARRGAGMGEP